MNQVGDLYTLTSSDTHGHHLLEARIRAIPSIVEEYLKQQYPKFELSQAKDSAKSFSITGVGSSKAHALYLVHLLNQIPNCHAEFKEYSSFSKGQAIHKYCILFSQGLNQHAQAVITSLPDKSSKIIFTAVKNNQQKKIITEALLRKGAQFITLPLEDEYQILLRVIGPLLGYIAAYRFASTLAKDLFPPINDDELITALKNSEAKAKQIFSSALSTEFESGLHIVTFSPISAFSHNLAEKFMEGALVHRPILSDISEFDHGRFQSLCKHKGRVILLRSDDPNEDKRVHLLAKELKLANLNQEFIIQSTLPTELRIVEYEMILNFLVLKIVKEKAVDQVNWPGKAMDLLYSSSE